MFEPLIPLDAPTALEVLRDVVTASDISSEPSEEIRYVHDPPNDDNWQRPEDTDARGAGDCEDLTIRWAAWLARLRPMYLCLAPMGGHVWHYYLREINGTIVDPSVLCGMRRPKAKKYRRYWEMRIEPEMFKHGAAGTPIEVGAGDEDLAAGFGTAAQVTGIAAMAVGAAFPPAGAIIGVIGAGVACVAGAFSSSAAKSSAALAYVKQAGSQAMATATAVQQREAKRRTSAAVLAVPPGKLLDAARKAAPGVAALHQATPASVALGRNALALVSGARTHPRLRLLLGNMLRAPVVDPGTGRVNEAAVAIRIAMATQALAPELDMPGPAISAAAVLQPEASSDDLEMVTEEAADDGQGDGEGPCCAKCAAEAAAGDDAADDDDDDDDDDDEGCATGACATNDEDDDAEDGDDEDGDAEDGDDEDGDAEDGDAEDGDAEDGDAEDGDAEDGDAEDGDAEDGDAEDGDDEEGDDEEGDDEEGDDEDGDDEDGDDEEGDDEDGDDEEGDDEDGDDEDGDDEDGDDEEGDDG